MFFLVVLSCVGIISKASASSDFAPPPPSFAKVQCNACKGDNPQFDEAKVKADVDGFWKYLVRSKQMLKKKAERVLVLLNGPPGCGKSSVALPMILKEQRLAEVNLIQIDPDEGRNFIDDYNHLLCGKYVTEQESPGALAAIFTNPVSRIRYEHCKQKNGKFLAAPDGDLFRTNMLNRIMVQQGRLVGPHQEKKAGLNATHKYFVVSKRGEDAAWKQQYNTLDATTGWNTPLTYVVKKKIATNPLLTKEGIFERAARHRYHVVYDSACLDGKWCSILGLAQEPLFMGSKVKRNKFNKRVVVFVYAPLNKMEENAKKRELEQGRGVFKLKDMVDKFWVEAACTTSGNTGKQCIFLKGEVLYWYHMNKFEVDEFYFVYNPGVKVQPPVLKKFQIGSGLGNVEMCTIPCTSAGASLVEIDAGDTVQESSEETTGVDATGPGHPEKSTTSEHEKMGAARYSVVRVHRDTRMTTLEKGAAAAA